MADRVVVDTSLQGGLTPDQLAALQDEVAELRQRAAAMWEEAIVAGDPKGLDEAKALVQQAVRLQQTVDDAMNAPAAVERLPMTAAELADHHAGQVEGQALLDGQAAAAAIETSLTDKVLARVDQLQQAAVVVESGNATPAQQRDALALCLRTTARLAKLVARELDEDI